MLKRDGTFWVELKATRTGSISFNSSGDNSDALSVYRKLMDYFEIVRVDAVRVSRDGTLREETGKLFVVTREALVRSRRGALADQRKELYKNFGRSIKILDSILDKGRSHVADAIPSKGEIGFEYPDREKILDLFLASIQIKISGDLDITIDDEGTGHQSMISLGLLKYVKDEARGRPVIFLIEEPEAFLHPHYQRAVAGYLADISKGAQVIATTHSPVILDSASIESIIRVPKSNEGLEYKKNPVNLSEKDVGILNRYCDVKNSEIIFADKIILCEGISDFYLIKKILSIVDPVATGVNNVSIIDCDGSAISHLVHLAHVFGIDCLAILDRDSYSGQRNVLKSICAQMERPLSASDYRVLDVAKNNIASSKSEAFDRRNSVNKILFDRGVFILSSDIEGSIVSSVSRRNLLRLAKKIGITSMGEGNVVALPNESNSDYLPLLFSLVGSKGFNAEKCNKGNKPKPHEIAILAGEACRYVGRGTDLYALQDRISSFIAR